MTRRAYPNLGTLRWVVEFVASCRVVALDDGSLWLTEKLGAEIAGGWEKTTIVRVERVPVRPPVCVLRAADGDVHAICVGFAALGNGLREQLQSFRGVRAFVPTGERRRRGPRRHVQ